MKSKVYLAGPITGQTLGNALGWREFAIEALAEKGIIGLNPLRGKEYLANLIEEDGLVADVYDVHPLSTAHGITMRDRWDATRCDLVLVYFPADVEKVSIGTVMEIAWASLGGKYVIVVMDDENVHNHAMIRDSASLVLKSLDEALALIPILLWGG